MLAREDGFERVTEDEGAAAIIFGTGGFLSGCMYLMAESGSTLYKDDGSAVGFHEAQPREITASASTHNPNLVHIGEILGGPALIGAVIGAVAVAGFRRLSHERTQKREKTAAAKKLRAELEIEYFDSLLQLEMPDPRR